MTIKNIVNSDAQKARHLKQANDIKVTSADIHIAACENLMHVIRAGNGDLSLCKHQCEALGLAKQSKGYVRVEALKLWYLRMSGNQIKVVDGNWKLVKGWKAEKFASEAKMEATDFAHIAAEKSYTDVNWKAIMGRLQGLTKMIDRAVDEGHFKGDPEACKEIVSNVVSFAAEAGRRLSAQQAGEALADVSHLRAKLEEVLPQEPNGTSRAAVQAAKTAAREASNGPQVDQVAAA